MLKELRVRAPEDVMLATFDDPEPAQSQIQFTTMRQPFRQIGMRAVDVLISRILEPELPDQNVRFRAELIVRGMISPSQDRAGNHSGQVGTQFIPTNGGNS